MVYSKNDFEKHINALKPDGFEKFTNFGSTRFVKREAKKALTIAIGYSEYFPHSVVIKGVSADIFFNEVETKVKPLLDKYSINKRYGNTTVQRSFEALQDINYKILETEINSEDSFKKVAAEVGKIVNAGALPFFEKYKDLKDVSDDICKMSEDELSNFVSGIIGIKVPLIKKLAQSADYLLDLQQRKKFYSDEVFKYPQYFKDHEKVFNDLFSDDLRLV